MAPKSTKTIVDSDSPSATDQPVQSEKADVNGSPRQLEAQETVQNGLGEITSEQSKWLTGFKLQMLSTAFIIANLMMAIDGSILATAIPHITNDFHTLDHIGWYGSAYLLSMMSFQPLFGRVYVYFEAKTMYLISLLIFEIGSVICASAPVSFALVFGRAVAGCGAAGMVTGSLAIFGRVVPLRKRPWGMSMMTSIYSLATMFGLTVGGVITDSHLTWRFCFWINLPFGFAAAAAMIYILERKDGREKDLRLLEKIWRLDPAGSILLSSSLVCLFLALQWGGASIPWSQPQAWGCLLGFGLLALSFVVLQCYKKERAVIPPRIIKQRTVAICCVFSFLYGIAVYTHSYILPTYFQAVRNTTAAMSGVYYLAFSISSTICTLAAGFVLTKFGYYVPFMWAGSVIYVAGSVLLHKLSPTSTTAECIGYQIVGGVGLGVTIQVAFFAVQVVTPSEDMPTACAVELFFRQLGGAVGVSIAENIFTGTVKNKLQQSIPGLDSSAILHAGIGDLVKQSQSLSPALQYEFKIALNSAITQALLLPVVVTSLAAVASWGMEWHRLPDNDE